MSHTRVYFSQWLETRLERAKKAKVKLSNKNIDKLRSVWIDWCIEQSPGESVLTVLFWCSYAETIDNFISDEITSSKSLFNYLLPNQKQSLIYYQPVVLGPEHGVVWNEEK